MKTSKRLQDFLLTYEKYVKPIEGYYVNDPNDKGGETYGGVARIIFPNWDGWAILDQWKAEHGTPKRNQQIPELDTFVTQFFYTLWVTNSFHKLTNRHIKDILFDWFVNTIRVYATTGRSVPVSRVQHMVGAKTDGVMGPNTVKLINTSEPEPLFEMVKAARKAFYDRLIAKDPTQEVFKKGWYKRINQFKYT